MNKYLLDLINRMLERSDCEMKPGFDSSLTISWKAMREAEKIENEDYVNQLIDFIIQEKNKSKRDKAYFILGHLSKNIGDTKSTEFLINQIEKETDKDIISSLLNRIRELNKAKGVDIRPIINASKSDKWQIRHSAIQALKNSSDKTAEERLIEILKSPINHFDLIYANATLCNIGSMKCIPFLMYHLDHKKIDVAQSALYAITQIAKEKEINTYRARLIEGKIKSYAIIGVVKYGNHEDYSIVENRLRELVSKKRKVKHYAEGMKTELIIGLEFLRQSLKYESIIEWLLTKKATMLWDFELEWINNNKARITNIA